MIYDTLSKYVLDNDYITPDRKYKVYLEMKQVYIDAGVKRSSTLKTE